MQVLHVVLGFRGKKVKRKNCPHPNLLELLEGAMEIFLGQMCFWVPCAHGRFLCCEKAGECLFGDARIPVVTAGRKGLRGKRRTKETQWSAVYSFVMPVSCRRSLCWALGDIRAQILEASLVD